MLTELLRHIVKLVWNALCILCRWVAAAKNTILTFRKSRRSAWNEDGDSLQDSTSHYSEMPGELSALEIERKAKLERAMKAPYKVKKQKEEHKSIEVKIREAGW